jgi:hypothetical protein
VTGYGSNWPQSAGPPSSHAERGHRGHVGTRTIASDRDARRVGAKLSGVQGRPARCPEAIFGASRKLVLGRQPVINRNHDASGAGAQIAAHAVMRIEATQHEAAAMEEDKQRKWTSTVRRV